MSTPAIARPGTDEFTDYLVGMTLEDGRQAAVELAVLRSKADDLVELLDGLSKAMLDVRSELLTDTGKADAEGRATAYADAARMVRGRFPHRWAG